ncbi:MAG: hypothetical protein PHE55_15805 [Methylococcaceae bacterium]|nr:hypothetical protein [Methylococcaceae bacterium]
MMRGWIGVLPKTLFLLQLFSLGIGTSFTVEAQEVIVSSDVQERNLPQPALRAVFGMRMLEWSNGKSIKVYVLPNDHPLHTEFTKKFLNMLPHQLKRAWDLLVFSGTGQAPTEVSSPKEMLEKVGSTPGAIGYLPENYPIKGEANEKVHVLEVR